jgi:hypothetical protein
MSDVLSEEAGGAEEALPLVWQVDLGRKQAGKRWFVVLLALLAGWVGWLMVGNWLLALIAPIAVLFSTTELFFPLKYRIDPRGASVRCGFGVTGIAWPDVKRVLADEDALKLSPLANPSMLAPFRGVLLRFAENKEEVVSRVEHHMKHSR